jgi:hypothetical protein
MKVRHRPPCHPLPLSLRLSHHDSDHSSPATNFDFPVRTTNRDPDARCWRGIGTPLTNRGILTGTHVQTGFPLTLTKQTAVVLSNRYDPTPLGRVASWLPHRPTLRISLAASSVEACPPDLWRANRNTSETGIAVTPSKQTTVVLSNRYKRLPPGGVASWLPFRPALSTSNRYTVRIEIDVTPSKQTTVVLSNRYKKPPPGGVASWLPHHPTLRNSNRYTVQTGIAVTLSKQTTVVLSNGYRKPPPGGVAFQLSRRKSGEHRRHIFRPPLFPIWAARVKWPPRRRNLKAPFEGIL